MSQNLLSAAVLIGALRVNSSKCAKISNTFHSLFSNKLYVTSAGIQITHIRIANSEDPDQTASEEAV